MDTYIVFWLAATVVFVLVELMTVGLTSIWFAAGSFVAFIIALLGGNVVVQGIVFILVSVVLLALTKPWAGKYINSRTVKTNVDSLVGERAVLTEDADSMKQTGKAVVNGQEWTVRPQDETQVIRKGELIEVVKISLNFLVLTSFHMVKPIPPMMISSIIVILTNGSSAYFVNDEYSSFMPIKSKPALQNADIEWNTEKYMPLNMPKSGMKRIAKSTAPMPSIRKVPLIIMLKSLTIPPISSALTLSCIRSLCLSPIFLCRSMENATPIEMKPMPPI